MTDDLSAQIDLLRKRLKREKHARLEAEDLLETKSLELYQANQDLLQNTQKAKNNVYRLNAIMNAISDCVITTDPEGIVQACNQATLNVLEKTVEELKGQSIFDNFDPADRPLYQRLCHDIYQNPDQKIPVHQKGGQDLFLLSRAGQKHPVEITLSTFRHDESLYLLHYIHDISSRKTIEAERLQLQQDLAQAAKWEAVGQLAGGIAHEINTPAQYVGDNLTFLLDSLPDLSAILSQALALHRLSPTEENWTAEQQKLDAMIQRHDLPFLLEEMPLALEQSREGIRQISHIVLAMKRFSHPSVNEKQDIDLHQAIETTLTVCHNEWKHVAKVSTAFDPSLERIPALASGLNQVLLNLIVNAAHAIADHHPNDFGQITLSTQREADYAVIRCADTGGGIPKQHQDHIFNPFFTTKDVGKGTGQGLAIAHDIIVNKHKGQFYFETEEGLGTTFIIKLPLHADV